MTINEERGGMKTFSWRKDLKLNAARCFSGTHATVRFTEGTFVTSSSRVKFALNRTVSKWGLSMKRRVKTLSWEKDLKLNDVEEDEDTLVEEVPQIESGTVFHRDTRHRAIHQRNIRDRVKRVLTWAMSKWRTSLLPFVKRRVKTLSWRKDRKFNAARCFSRTHATVRFAQETVVTSGSCVNRFFDQGDVKVANDIVTFNEEEDGDTLVEEVPQIERGTVFLRDTYRHVGFWYRNIRDKRFPREA